MLPRRRRRKRRRRPAPSTIRSTRISDSRTAVTALPYVLADVDLARGAHKAPEFLRKNPFGQVPVLEDGDVVLADSNAILTYLASRYDDSGRWYSREPVAAAHAQRWLSIAAGPLAYGPATARLAMVRGGATG